MYLSKLEMVGFKSFANRTVLDFEPGMTAVVGPNGCGKSNISDAIRWVLGEQSAKAMRGKKMQDCIFDGADTKKRLGMAEVSLTLSDCEKILGVDYNEVTVTRRVFRSGDSEYLINKGKCRLKDIQRLFMDTGVGTQSYSVMEQGRIDYILSARPEDRRAVFEEASGITKYKADKKEALRKLEHTEANLLRLEDIIREVKRQIVSLQRQAGKARRYKSMREEVRGLDIYLARKKMGDLDKVIGDLAARQTELNRKIESAKQDLAAKEEEAASLRRKLANSEQQIESAMQEEAEARSRLEKTRELIEVNTDRIEELKTLADRDSRDAAAARSNLEEHNSSLEKLGEEIDALTQERDQARQELDRSTEVLKEAEKSVEELGTRIHNLRSEAIDLESRYSNLQNELNDLEAKERSTTIRRERLTAELAELKEMDAGFGGRQQEMESKVTESEQTVEECRQRLESLTDKKKSKELKIEELKSSLAEWRNQISAKEARIELLQQSQAQGEGFSNGARKLMQQSSELSIDTDKVVGSLAEQLVPEPGYGKAFEVALRSWMDAVIMSDMESSLQALAALIEAEAGSVRILTVEGHEPPKPLPDGVPGDPLRKHIEVPPGLEPLADRLTGRVFVVDSIQEARSYREADLVFVTKSGELFDGRGTLELWMPTDEKANPLARKQMIREWEAETKSISNDIEKAVEDLDTLEADNQTFEQKIGAERKSLEEKRTQLAMARDEQKRLMEDSRQTRERLETVQYEINAISETDSSARERRDSIQEEMQKVRKRQAEIRETISELNEKLRESEQNRSRLLSEVTDKRVAFTEKEQRVINLQSRRENLDSRVAELKVLIEERSSGVDSYRERIERLEKSLQEARESLEPRKEEAQEYAAQLQEAREKRKEFNSDLASVVEELDKRRTEIDNLQAEISKNEIGLTEQRMRRENIVERITDEYSISEQQMMEEPEPEWENGEQPPYEEIEKKVGEIKAKLEKMGPVNLVAIDEHRELEDRFEFLKKQQEDLTNSRDQLLSMIKHINKTSTDMFMNSFNSINENFKQLFTEMFGGGSAQLELSEEGDILEAGIEIVARPPGKKLQTVSLLSGGERTMTAIALLFALYEEKPSAFCLLDELDAALDESNIDRFLRVVQKFLKQSQFIVITHNQKTIAAADVLYGVTMEERGVSKIVSVKFHGKQLSLPTEEAQPKDADPEEE